MTVKASEDIRLCIPNDEATECQAKRVMKIHTTIERKIRNHLAGIINESPVKDKEVNVCCSTCQ